ncbi:MAG: hypothetical protein ACD_3C00086G0007 [uncultured bacterium (gcode 4)]|uniref:Rubredoxin-like domain-containing protein n=1 Tax=uncultured bacterium (gcode 4) TaxID=1234023 RepID=K2FZ16_9BACT|nr:MAG: hypothetical protein ACD_3C00086G0007 [uncultured bacterium (gcode 4)]
MNNYIKYIKLILLLSSLAFILVFISPRETFKQFGTVSWLLLVLVMIIRPLNDIFSRNKLLSFIIKFRRELGILVWVFSIAHAIWAFSEIMYWENLNSSIDVLRNSILWDYELNYLWGIIAFLISLPLLITSNSMATSILKTKWKILQRLSYFMFIFVGLHIFMIKWDTWPLYILWFWISIYIWAYIKNKRKLKKSSNSPRWLCVPCSYIYDESIWDIDGWIMSWTKFEDIPMDWRCPVCWVTKSDFILLEWEITTDESKIVSLKFLNTEVIELKLELKDDYTHASWQFLNFALEDLNWKFNRSYSIADKKWNVLMFLIKLKQNWRAWEIFKSLKAWDKIYHTWISWNFVLNNTLEPKVFIATWTWLAPIYSMLINTEEDVMKKLYFWVSKASDLFYTDELKQFKNLEINIFLSKEETKGYNYWRISLENIDFGGNCEFYICWNPWTTADISNNLLSRWFGKVYFEKFI